MIRPRVPRSAEDALRRVNYTLPLGCQNVIKHSLPKRDNIKSEAKSLTLKIESKSGFYTFRAECLRVLFYAFSKNDLDWYSRVGQQLSVEETRLALARQFSTSSIDCIDWDLMASKYLNLHPAHNFRTVNQMINPLLDWAIQRTSTGKRDCTALQTPSLLPTIKEIRKVILNILDSGGTLRERPVQIGLPQGNPLGIHCMRDTSKWRDPPTRHLYYHARTYIRSTSFKFEFPSIGMSEKGYNISKTEFDRLALMGDALFYKASSLLIGDFIRDLPTEMQMAFYIQAMTILNTNSTMGIILDSQGYFRERVAVHNAGSHFEAIYAIFHELNLGKLDTVSEWIRATFTPILVALRDKFVTMDMKQFEPITVREANTLAQMSHAPKESASSFASTAAASLASWNSRANATSDIDASNLVAADCGRGMVEA